MNLIKAAGHKYTHRKLVGRDPKTNRARYRYYYAEHHGGGITSAKFEEGAAFKLTFKGRRGHFHINRVEGDKVFVKHDGRPGSKEVEMSQDELRALLEKQHAKAETKSREKAQKRRKSATKKRKSTKRKKPREQLTETAAQAQQSADNFETMPEEPRGLRESRASLKRKEEILRDSKAVGTSADRIKDIEESILTLRDNVADLEESHLSEVFADRLKKRAASAKGKQLLNALTEAHQEAYKEGGDEKRARAERALVDFYKDTSIERPSSKERLADRRFQDVRNINDNWRGSDELALHDELKEQETEARQVYYRHASGDTQYTQAQVDTAVKKMTTKGAQAAALKFAYTEGMERAARELEAQAQQSADNFETMPEETQAPSAEYKETRAQILRERSGDFDRQKLKELEKRLKTQTGPDSARASEEHINSLLTLARTPEMKRLVDNVVAEHKGTTPQTQLDAITEYMTEKAPPRAPLPEDQSPESLTYELAKVRERATADLNRASRGELLPPTIAELEAQRDAAYDAIPSAPSDARLKAQEEYYRREALATATRHVYSAAISEAIQNRTGQQIQQLEQLIFEKKQERAEERAKAKEAQAQQSAFKDLSTEDRAQISTVVSELDKTGGKILNVEKQGDGYVVTIDPFSALDERPTRFSFGRSRGGDIRSSGLQESSRGHAADAETNAHVKTFGKRLKDIIKNDERFESFYMIKRPKKKRVRDGQTWFPVDQDEENYFVFEFETAAQAEDRAGQGVSQTAQAFKEMVSTIKSESKGEAAQAAQKKFKAGLDEIIEKTKAGTLTDAERAELLPITEELVEITSGRARNLMIMIREQVKASSERRGG
jgi:hypothetical protein